MTVASRLAALERDAWADQELTAALLIRRARLAGVLPADLRVAAEVFAAVIGGEPSAWLAVLVAEQ